jgi:hypothetical protein
MSSCSKAFRYPAASRWGIKNHDKKTALTATQLIDKN